MSALEENYKSYLQGNLTPLRTTGKFFQVILRKYSKVQGCCFFFEGSWKSFWNRLWSYLYHFRKRLTYKYFEETTRKLVREQHQQVEKVPSITNGKNSFG